MVEKFEHDPALARAVFEAARRAGFKNISYENFLRNYVKPLLRMLLEEGELDGVEGLKV